MTLALALALAVALALSSLRAAVPFVVGYTATPGSEHYDIAPARRGAPAPAEPFATAAAISSGGGGASPSDGGGGGVEGGLKARPRGRAPAGKVWNRVTGAWEDDRGEVRAQAQAERAQAMAAAGAGRGRPASEAEVHTVHMPTPPQYIGYAVGRALQEPWRRHHVQVEQMADRVSNLASLTLTLLPRLTLAPNLSLSPNP